MTWPMVKLSAVCQVNPRLPKTYDENQEVSFLAMASVSEDGKLLTQETRILGETKKGFTYFERGDVIVAKITPCFENGKAVYLEELNTQIGFGSTEFHVLRPDTERLNGKYLFYLIWNSKFRSIAERSMSGSAGQKRVPADFFKNFEIPLPPLAEQKRIAAILDKADAIRQKRQQAIALADQFLRSVFLDMFGDPVTNPKGWKIKSLSEIAKIQIGPFGSQLHKEDYVTGGIPLINPTHICNGKVEPDEDLTIARDMYASLPQYHLKVGDIVMGRRGEMGRCALITANEDGWFCGTGSLYIRPQTAKSLSTYLVKLLSGDTIKEYLLAESLGATMPNLNKNIIGNIKIPIPSEPTLKKYATFEKAHAGLITKTIKNHEDELFFSLSQKAFSGQL